MPTKENAKEAEQIPSGVVQPAALAPAPLPPPPSPDSQAQPSEPGTASIGSELAAGRTNVSANLTGEVSVKMPPSRKQAFWEHPAFVAAWITLIGVIIVALVNLYIHKKRNEFDDQSATKKFDFEDKMALKKFEFDNELAARKAKLEREYSDWKRKAEFAEANIAEFYEARIRLRAIRSPMGFGYENSDRPGREEEAEKERNLLDRYYPTWRRIRDNAEFFDKFYAKRFRAAAIFGASASDPYDRIWKALHKVRVGVQMLLSRVPGDKRTDHEDRMEERIWEGLSDQDEIAREVDDAVASAEAIFLEVIFNMPKV